MARRRHLTPKEICAQCNAIARESRMADRTPWTAMGIMCSYAVMKTEGLKGKRIARIINRVNELEELWCAGEIDLEVVDKNLHGKVDWPLGHEPYTEADIKYRKGSFEYWFDSVQIGAQNTINEQATRYLLFFFTALIDVYGFGKERLNRVENYFENLLRDYQKDKRIAGTWKVALQEEAGMEFEMPIDPKTQKIGSVMTG